MNIDELSEGVAGGLGFHGDMSTKSGAKVKVRSIYRYEQNVGHGR